MRRDKGVKNILARIQMNEKHIDFPIDMIYYSSSSLFWSIFFKLLPINETKWLIGLQMTIMQ